MFFSEKDFMKEVLQFDGMVHNLFHSDSLISIPLIPFADWDYYALTDDLTYDSSDGNMHIVVPKGFVTNLASVPRLFWAVLPPTGRYALPAVIHDYLYWFQPYPKSAADGVLRDAMQQQQVAENKAEIIYQAVHWFGKPAWDRDGALRAGGEQRILAKFPEDASISWSVWRQRPDVFVS